MELSEQLKRGMVIELREGTIGTVWEVQDDLIIIFTSKGTKKYIWGYQSNLVNDRVRDKSIQRIWDLVEGVMQVIWDRNMILVEGKEWRISESSDL